MGYECFLQDNQSVDPLSPPQPSGKIVTARSIGANVTSFNYHRKKYQIKKGVGELGKECWEGGYEEHFQPREYEYFDQVFQYEFNTTV